jgi:UDP-glucose 4-epimerase
MLFITGSESFIGKRLIEICKKNNIKYFGVDTNTKNTLNSKKLDIRDKNLHKYIPVNSTVIHLAAISNDKDCNLNPFLCIDVNVNGTLNLIKAAKKKLVKTFIFASSEWVYGDKRSNLLNENSDLVIDKKYSLYAQSKIVIEKFLDTNRTFKNINILRFGIIYGSSVKKNWSLIEKIFEKVKNNNNLLIGSKKTARKFIHLDDLINGILLSIKLKGFNILNLTSNEKISLKQIVEISEKFLQKKIKVIELNAKEPSIRNINSIKAQNLLNWKLNIKFKNYIKNLCYK